MCLDPKDLNQAIQRGMYPILTVEKSAAKFSGAQVFTVVDMKSGFWHILCMKLYPVASIASHIKFTDSQIDIESGHKVVSPTERVSSMLMVHKNSNILRICLDPKNLN